MSSLLVKMAYSETQKPPSFRDEVHIGNILTHSNCMKLVREYNCILLLFFLWFFFKYKKVILPQNHTCADSEEEHNHFSNN